MPKLIGMWKLPFPRWRKTHPTAPREMISHVACAEDGQQWGLVVQLTKLDETMSRIVPVRWVRWEATPFAPEEVVTIYDWLPAPADDVAARAVARSGEDD